MIMKKLCQGGAKLLTGPRGCGKTTLLLRAQSEMKNKRKTFAIYVNFKTSLKIEPLYRSNFNGSYWFNQWLLLKIFEGIYDSLRYYDVDISVVKLCLQEEDVKEYLSEIELGLIDRLKVDGYLTIDLLENEIKKILDINNYSSCVLLLDDAAHAFSKEQQYDFFEFFRSIKSKIISPKAAIYPGVTNFSASFHVGHDAEEINVWIKTIDDHYIDFMTQLLKKRVQDSLFNKLSEDENLFKLICYSSFGIPRSLLNIVRFILNDDTMENVYNIVFSRRNIMKAIKDVNESTFLIYRSLENKLPIYKDFVKEGSRIFDKMIDYIKDYNKLKDVNKKTVEIAIKNPLPSELEKVFDFYQYAGLLMYEKEVSKGEKGRYSIFIMNYGILVEQNAFFTQKSVKTVDLATALSQRDVHEYKRLTVDTLINGKEISKVFPLSLPPCPKCNTPRISPDTKFCSECGEKLTTSSIFEELVNNDISMLPLTKRRIDAIKNNSSIRNIRDILMDTEHKKLRSVPQIGPSWAKKIFSYAEEYIG